MIHFQLPPQFVGEVEAFPRAGAGSLCEGGRAVMAPSRTPRRCALIGVEVQSGWGGYGRIY